jgi:hypothetical protein
MRSRLKGDFKCEEMEVRFLLVSLFKITNRFERFYQVFKPRTDFLAASTKKPKQSYTKNQPKSAPQLDNLNRLMAANL